MFIRFFSLAKVAIISTLVFAGLVQAEQLQHFKPFEISVAKSVTSTSTVAPSSGQFIRSALVSDQSGFDFFTPQEKGYHFSANTDGVFGDELVMGMKFADWLTLRVNVIDETNPSHNLFNTAVPVANYSKSNEGWLGYQFGVSSVLNLTNNWRFGIDLGMGRVGGEMMGLYEDQIETTRLGFGIRNQKFGATFQSDFMNGMSNTQLEQSTMDLQLDWHFTREGTISFGARRNIRDNTTTGNVLDDLTGTVPYIKFKHNL